MKIVDEQGAGGGVQSAQLKRNEIRSTRDRADIRGLRGVAVKRVKLEWLEVGRGLAALCVVLTHYSALGGGKFFTPLRGLGGGAVEFFFVLSGFIIFYVHGSEIGVPASVNHYAWRRFVRVFPTYWIIFAAAIIARPFQPTLPPLATSRILTEAFMGPGRLLIVGPIWTLRHEVLFYTVFGCALLNRRTGGWIFLAWMAAVAVHLAVAGLPSGHVVDPVGIVLHHYNLDFLLGILVAAAAQKGRIVHALAVAVASAACLVAIYLLTGAMVVHALLYKALFAGVVSVAVIASLNRIPAPKTLITLGAASYSLYLSHELVGSATARAFRHVSLEPVAIIFMRAALAIAFAIIFHKTIERPMVKWLQSRQLNWRVQRPAEV